MKKDLAQMRNDVIEKFINCESIINAIISQNFFKRVDTDFLFDVLYDEYFSFALKRRILEKVLKVKDEKIIQALNRMNTIRNHFVHCNQEVFKAGESESFIPNPRNPQEGIDFEKLYKEFLGSEKDVIEYLFDKFKKMGGIANSEKP
jgi:hypothetical protein